jgi:hypothetical protein
MDVLTRIQQQSFRLTCSCSRSPHLPAPPQVALARLRHRAALLALNRWREFASERLALRAKAQAVVKHMLLRRLYAGFW